MDLCFIIDASSSIISKNPPDLSYDNWELQLEFLTLLLNLFEIGQNATRVGAVVFSEEVQLAFPLNAYTEAESVKRAIHSINILRQQTNTAEALKVTRERCFSEANGDRPKVQNLAIMITDGRPEPDTQIRMSQTLNEAEALKESGTIILTIGVTNDVDRQFLDAVSSSSALQMNTQLAFYVDDFSLLGTIRRSVGEGICASITGMYMIKNLEQYLLKNCLRKHVINKMRFPSVILLLILLLTSIFVHCRTRELREAD